MEQLRTDAASLSWICSVVEATSILVIGCGDGAAPVLLAREGGNVVGIDVDKKAITHAQHLLEGEPAEVRSRLKLQDRDFLSSSFEKGEFGSIVMPDVLGWLASPERFVRAAYDLLDDHGSLIASISFKESGLGKPARKRSLLGFLRLLDRWFRIDDYSVSDAWFGVKMRPRIELAGQVSNLNWDLALASERAFLVMERSLLQRLVEAEEKIRRLEEACEPISSNEGRDLEPAPADITDVVDPHAAMTPEDVSFTASDVDAEAVLSQELQFASLVGLEDADPVAGCTESLARIAELEAEAESRRAMLSILEDHFHFRLESPAAARALVSDALSVRLKLVSAYDELSGLKQILKKKSREMDLAKVRATHGVDDVLEGSRNFVRDQAQIIAKQLTVLGDLKGELSQLSIQSESLAMELSRREEECWSLRNHVAFIENSVRFKLGAELLSALRNPVRWFGLPRRVYKIYRDWRKWCTKQDASAVFTPRGSERLDEFGDCLRRAHDQVDAAVNAELCGGIAGDDLGTWWVGEDTTLPLRKLLKQDDVACVRFGNGAPLLFRLEARGASSMLLRLQFNEIKGAIHLDCKAVIDTAYYGGKPPADLLFKKVIPYQQESDHTGLLIRFRIPKGCEAVEISLNGAEMFVLQNHVDIQSLLHGVSVVIPSYLGQEKIGGALASIARQTLGHEMIELIVVSNGPRDSTLEKVRGFSRDYPDISIKTAHLDDASAGGARNLGLALASREYVAFLDDDDSLSDSYLEALLDSASPSVVVFTQIRDEINGELSDSVINEPLRLAARSGKVDAQMLAGIVTMSACKLIPAVFAKQVRFNRALRSGEDVHYFVVMFSLFNPGLRVVPLERDAFYIRTITVRSVSRQDQSREFSIDQRLAVIAAIQADAASEPRGDIYRLYLNSMRAQMQFCMRYLADNPGERSYFNQKLLELGIAGSDCVRWANELMAEDLVFSYCFPPFIDTAGIVMAKRINEAGRPVNVISNDMSDVRQQDSRLLEIVSADIGNLAIVKCKPSFGGWNLIAEYVSAANSIAERQLEQRGREYARIYSRAMWPGSHFAAAKFKAEHPDVVWVAEFSDPVLIDIHGETRKAPIDFGWIDSLGLQGLGAHLLPDGSVNANMYYWCEMLAYLMADELVFTNSNQLEYMLSFVRVDSVKERVRSIAVIKPHPTLSSRYYGLSALSANVGREKVSFAYFGSFYESRGVRDVLAALCELTAKERELVTFHIYTSQAEAVVADPQFESVSDCVEIHGLVGYLDFLKLSDEFDYLVVCDAQTAGKKFCNPYLPSKVSDYLGSPSSKVWAIVEEDSPLCRVGGSHPDKVSVTHLGDIQENTDFIRKALGGYFGPWRSLPAQNL